MEWEVYDQDEFMKNPYAPIKIMHKTSLVKLPPTSVSGMPGAAILVAHFYPDDHVEFEFRDDLSGSRILYADVWDWLRKKHERLINPNGDPDSVVFRRVAKIASNGWLKYGFEETEDLKQYCLLYLRDPAFDERPEVKRILQETKGKSGAFGAEMRKITEARIGR